MIRQRKGFTSEEIKDFVSELRVEPHNNLDDVSYPSISVVVPSYNQGKFIERTILSILNQNFPGTELIIIDGGSTDETLSVVKKYEKYISYWKSEPDKGQSHALDKGFSRARGDIFAWQNSDDIYLPGAFHAAMQVFLNNPSISVCYGNWYSIDADDFIIDTHYSLNPRVPHAPFENMDAYNQTIFWRRSAFERVGGFDVNLQQLMDGDLIIRLLLTDGIESFYKYNQFLGCFRRHNAQKTDLYEMTEKQFAEEEYIENKFNFPQKTSMEGKYYRMRYRFAQLFESLLSGGPAYTLHKFKVTYNRRGRFF